MASILAKPFRGAGDLLFKNRVGLAPLTRSRADPITGKVNELHVQYYSERASGGLIFTEATGISRQGLGWWGAPGVYTPEQVESWKAVTAAVHKAGGLIFCQLWHMGRAGHSDVFQTQPVSASPIALEGEVTAKAGEKKPYEVPHALTEAEITVVVSDFVKASANALEAGFDGVELHGANGYLIDQFIQSVSNKRTDKYGGSLENRLRFLREVTEAVVATIPKERVWIRFSPNSAYQGMGAADNNETFTEAIRLVSSYKIGGVEVLDGLGFGFHQKSEPFTLKAARQAVLAGNPEGTTALCGNVGHTKESAEKEISEGNTDFISFGRPYMSNPDLPERFFEGIELAPPPEYPDWWTKTGADGYITWPRAAKPAAPAK